jgi:hypothetical protein
MIAKGDWQMKAIEHKRFFMLFSLCLIVAVLVSACETPPTEQPREAADQSEITEAPSPMVETFTQEDGSSEVRIELPWQGSELTFSRKPFEEELGAPDVPSGYEFLKPIIYIQVLDPSRDNIVVHDFNPPLLMTAQYNRDELDELGIEPSQLVIAIYDHENGVFQPYETSIDESANIGSIMVTHWTSHACWLRK